MDFQLKRHGYFAADGIDMVSGTLVFNRGLLITGVVNLGKSANCKLQVSQYA